MYNPNNGNFLTGVGGGGCNLNTRPFPLRVNPQAEYNVPGISSYTENSTFMKLATNIREKDNLFTFSMFEIYNFIKIVFSDINKQKARQQNDQTVKIYALFFFISKTTGQKWFSIDIFQILEHFLESDSLPPPSKKKKTCLLTWELNIDLYFSHCFCLCVTGISMVADLCHFVFSLFRGDITKAP